MPKLGWKQAWLQHQSNALLYKCSLKASTLRSHHCWLQSHTNTSLGTAVPVMAAKMEKLAIWPLFTFSTWSFTADELLVDLQSKLQCRLGLLASLFDASTMLDIFVDCMNYAKLMLMYTCGVYWGMAVFTLKTDMSHFKLWMWKLEFKKKLNSKTNLAFLSVAF